MINCIAETEKKGVWRVEGEEGGKKRYRNRGKGGGTAGEGAGSLDVIWTHVVVGYGESLPRISLISERDGFED